MTNPFYTPTGNPQPQTRGLASTVRAEFDLVQDGFDSVSNSLNTQQVTATSTTSLSVTVATKSFTTQTGKAFYAGQSVSIAYTTNPTTRMVGIVLSYDSTTGAMEVGVQTVSGTGTYAAWTIALSPSNASDVPLTYDARTANAQITAADRYKLIDITTAGFTQTFDTPANLNATPGWFTEYRNSSTGIVTIPASDGLTNWEMYPGEHRRFYINPTGPALASYIIRPFINTWTSSGSFIMPPGYAGEVDCDGWGGSGGGGSGARNTNINQPGGGGGGGGSVRTQFKITGLTAGTTYVVTIGAAGTGGAAVTADGTNGNNGTSGGNTTLGSVFTAFGGAAGGGGTAAGNGPGGGGAGYASAGSSGTGGKPGSGAAADGGPEAFGGANGGSSGGAGVTAFKGGGGGGGGAVGATAGTGGGSYEGGGGGGGGGGYSGSLFQPAAGGASRAITGGTGGAAGVSHATTPTAGTAGTAGTGGFGGFGGGGGGSATGAAAAAGGAGGAPGGGGGGGGASFNGFNSGAGGVGAAGKLTIRGC